MDRGSLKLSMPGALRADMPQNGAMRIAYVSRRVVLPTGELDGAVVVDGERVERVCGRGEVPDGVAVRVLEDDVAILPGLVDTHVHINEPGRTEWEGFRTATRAAAAGGFTTLVDMPLNCLPETTTVTALEEKRRAAAGQCAVDWMSWAGAVDGNQEHLLPLAAAGVPGWKCFLVYPGCEGFTSIDAANLEAALPLIASTGLPLLVHAELQGPIDAACAALPLPDDSEWRRYATYLASRPDAAETEAIAWLLELCRRYRFRLHIVHLATALALPMLRAAKLEGLAVTVETCPHYLHLCAEEIADGATAFKCAPPIRSRANREALWEGLRDGTIDLVATDHSPCPPAMKRAEDGRFNVAWGGIASLSTALSVVWTEARARGFGLADVARWMGVGPAALAGLRRCGAIAGGCAANLVLFAPEAERRVTVEGLFYRHPVSPYLGETLRGVVRETVLRGETVYREGGWFATPGGCEVRGGGMYADSSERALGCMSFLERWNAMTMADAAEAVLPCCGSRAWAAGLGARRPLGSLPELLAASDSTWWSLPVEAWDEAFRSHPRIGERHAAGAATVVSLRWSEAEQNSAAESDFEDSRSKTSEEIDVEIADRNRAYEARFGRVFLVRAAGRGKAEMLALLQRRLQATEQEELQEAAEQQREITHLRLQRWLAEHEDEAGAR